MGHHSSSTSYDAMQSKEPDSVGEVLVKTEQLQHSTNIFLLSRLQIVLKSKDISEACKPILKWSI